jgi:hypothetical protein
VTSYDFTDVRRDHAIDASFIGLGPFTITATAETGGSISPGAASVNCGQSQQFDITPGAGYVIFDVLVDETSVGTPASYTFENVYADHTLRARFAVDSVGAPDPSLAAAVWLGPATPSPVRSAAEIHLRLPRATDVSLTVHDVRGRMTAMLANGLMPAGERVVRWNARDQSGARVPSGVYFYRLEAAGKVFERKLIVLR